MATAPLKTKRSPTVLITDSREPLPRSGKTPKSNRPPMLQRASTKLISVDNVLQYASEIPSGQRRGPQPQQARNHSRTPSGRHPLDPKLTGRLVQQQHMPSRSSKVSEKLVLLPETQDVADEEKAGFEDEDQDVAPPKDDIADKRKRTPTGLKEKSYAERLPKSSRTEKLSRVTAYCTAQAYKMRATADFVRQRHGAKTKLYDDCLYTVYHLPLVPGDEGFRIRSSPVLKSPGGKAVLDEEIERNERHEYREGFFGEEQYGVRGNEDGEERKRERQSGEGDLNAESPKQGEEEQNHGPRSDNEAEQSPHGNDSPTPQNQPSPQETIPPSNPPPQQYPNRSSSPPALASQLAANLSTFAEMFIFSYGIVVFWNFTERQEKDILADLTFASHPQHTILSAHAKAAQAYANMKHSSDLPTPIPVPETVQVPLAVRPQPESDFETEEFHFEYNPAIARPRLYNDMITLRSGDHMIKLAMSHAIAQSTKLSFFEERMADTMVEAQYVPRTLALHGELGMKREEVVRILGRLFVSRVDVNLCKSPPPSRSPRKRKRNQKEEREKTNPPATPFSAVQNSPKKPLTHLARPPNSLEHARRPQFLLGLGAHPAPALRRRAPVPRDQAAHPGPQRALPRLPRPRRDPVRLRRRPQDVAPQLDRHYLDCSEYPGHDVGGVSQVRDSVDVEGVAGGAVGGKGEGWEWE